MSFKLPSQLKSLLEQHKGESVLLGLSGGVDSSAVAHMLVKAGLRVIGVTLKLRNLPTLPDSESLKSANATAKSLGIEHHVIDVTQAFSRRVVDSFINDYATGRTPNPCIVCNPLLKIYEMMRLADELGVTWVSTGHYARSIQLEDETSRIATALSLKRDQSYFLARVPQAYISRLLLPLGYIDGKETVRAYAECYGLSSAKRPDSQDVCFLQQETIYDLLAAQVPHAVQPGPIVNANGKVLGEHRGFGLYTIGQRKGLGIASGTPQYVVEIRPDRNEIVLGKSDDLYVSKFIAHDVIAHEAIGPHKQRFVKIRSTMKAVPCKVAKIGDASVCISTEQPVNALAPGQSAVWYDDEGRVCGGGFIS